MKAFLARRWFLLVILLGVAAVWLWPEGLHWTAYLDPAVTGALAIFLSAWGLEGRRLVQALARPVPALMAVVVSYGLVPVLAWLASRMLPEVDLQIGLVLMASVPCTLASATLWTRLAGGNDATALLVTLLTNLTSWLFTTAWLLLLTGIGQESGRTAGMMLRLVLVLVVPVALGQGLRSAGALARFADRHRLLLGVAARLLTVSIMLKAAVEVRGRLEAQAASVAGVVILLAGALCLATHLAALGSGFWGGRLLGLARPDRIAVALAGSQKTLPVALILFDAYFQAYPLAILPLAFFHVGQLVVDTFIAEQWAGKKPPEPEGLPAAEVAAEAVL